MTCRTVESRFWSKVDTGPGLFECWPWRGATNGRGYGWFHNEHGRGEGAHRAAWRLSGRELPAELDVLHSCDNPACVNVAHLHLGTARDNAREMVERGRHRTGGPRSECRRGHPLVGFNVFARADGKRECRTCIYAARRARWANGYRPPSRRAGLAARS